MFYRKIFISLLVGVVGFMLLRGQNTITTPDSYPPLPTQAQWEWQRMKMYAFIHFGLNTYTDKEWGYGNASPKLFNPPYVDCDKWVRLLKKAGMKGIIFTAKHHDGFCLWPTKTTDYSIKQSPWRGGRGDLVRELSRACHKYGLKFGLYLSPWDRHNAHYGEPSYQKIFHQQIRELSTHYGKLFEYWFDGANGGNGWYGGANTIRQIDPNTYYGYDDAIAILKKNNPNIMIFGGTSPTIRWVGNEKGFAGMTNWSRFRYGASSKNAPYGDIDGNKWIPAECDVSIRPGWFYHHREDHQIKSISNLVDLYFKSVGRNANLLLNVPIDPLGDISALDSARLMGFKLAIDSIFARNIFRKATILVSNNFYNKDQNSDVESLHDDCDSTYWSTDNDIRYAYITVKLPKIESINILKLQEYIPLGQKVDHFEVFYGNQHDQWQKLTTQDSLTTIGYTRLIRFNTINTQYLRIYFHAIKGPICIANVAAYYAKEHPQVADVQRASDGIVTISTPSKDAQIYYQVGAEGAKQLYTTPFAVYDNNVNLTTWVKINGQDEVATDTTLLGYAARMIKLDNKDFSDDAYDKLFDTDGYTAFRLPLGERAVKMSFKVPLHIKKIVYLPDQRRDATGHIVDYEIWGDGKLLTKGTFDNIENNPDKQIIILQSSPKLKTLTIKATRITGNSQRLSIGSILLYGK